MRHSTSAQDPIETLVGFPARSCSPEASMVKKNGLSIRSYASSVAVRTPAALDAQSASLQLQIDESERSTVETTLASRSCNTYRKYEPYQQEFIDWCVSQHFSDGGTVTGGKLHLFLSQVVIGRKSKKNKDKVIGGSTVCGYVNAVVDLYNQQVGLRVNCNCSSTHQRSQAAH